MAPSLSAQAPHRAFLPPQVSLAPCSPGSPPTSRSASSPVAESVPNLLSVRAMCSRRDPTSGLTKSILSGGAPCPLSGAPGVAPPRLPTAVCSRAWRGLTQVCHPFCLSVCVLPFLVLKTQRTLEEVGARGSEERGAPQPSAPGWLGNDSKLSTPPLRSPPLPTSHSPAHTAARLAPSAPGAPGHPDLLSPRGILPSTATLPRRTAKPLVFQPPGTARTPVPRGPSQALPRRPGH